MAQRYLPPHVSETGVIHVIQRGEQPLAYKGLLRELLACNDLDTFGAPKVFASYFYGGNDGQRRN